MRKFLKNLFSESGEVSFGRIGAYHALVAALVWVSYVVFTTKVIPDLGGISLFIGTLYGLSKGLGAIKRDGNETNPPAQ